MIKAVIWKYSQKGGYIKKLLRNLISLFAFIRKALYQSQRAFLLPAKSLLGWYRTLPVVSHFENRRFLGRKTTVCETKHDALHHEKRCSRCAWALLFMDDARRCFSVRQFFREDWKKHGKYFIILNKNRIFARNKNLKH